MMEFFSGWQPEVLSLFTSPSWYYFSAYFTGIIKIVNEDSFPAAACAEDTHTT